MNPLILTIAFIAVGLIAFCYGVQYGVMRCAEKSAMKDRQSAEILDGLRQQNQENN